MNDIIEKDHLARYAQQLERQMGWGPIAEWAQRDFANLANLIEQRTGTHLSVSTLKRTLGRIAFDGTPQPATLCALAKFLGYDDWMHFRQPNIYKPHEEPDLSEISIAKDFNKPTVEEAKPAYPVIEKESVFTTFRIMGLLVLGGLLGSGILAFIWWPMLSVTKAKPTGRLVCVSNSNIKSNHDELGAPYLAHFQYQLSKDAKGRSNLLSFGDENQTLRFADVSDDALKNITFKYSRPGYYYVKLFSNDLVLSKTQVLIPSDGWQAFVGQKSSDDEAPLHRSGEALSIAPSALAVYDSEKFDRLHTQFSNYRDFKVDGNDFTMNMRLRCLPSKYNGREPKVFMKLKFAEESSILTLDSSPTVLSIFSRFGNHYVDTLTQKAAFHQDISNWSNIELKQSQGVATVRFNGKEIYSGKFTNDFGRLNGLSIQFRGVGEIQRVDMSDGNGKLVYKDVL